MALSSTQLDLDAAFIVKVDLPDTITLSGTAYTGTQMSVRQARESAVEGFHGRYVFSFYLVIADLLGATPAVDDLATIAAVEYIVIGLDTDDAGDIIRLDLGEKFGGI